MWYLFRHDFIFYSFNIFLLLIEKNPICAISSIEIREAGYFNNKKKIGIFCIKYFIVISLSFILT